MGCKEDREQLRHELYGQFVSVNTLIEVLAEAEEMEPYEIAAALLVAFEEADEKVMRPAFGSIDTVRIKFGQHEFYDPEEGQKEVLKESLLTIAEGYKNDGDDQIGWLRGDLLPFLRANGFDRPVYFPPWSPLEEIMAEGTQTEGNAQEIGSANFSDQIQSIESETFTRLMRAIEAFPKEYPDYKRLSPKLNIDVRPWLHKDGLVNDGEEGREAAVFGRIIAEHFKLSGVTRKTK